MHDGNVISSGTVTNSSEQVFLTHTVTEDGFYQCFATNEFGCEQWTTFAAFGAPVSTGRVNMLTDQQSAIHKKLHTILCDL